MRYKNILWDWNGTLIDDAFLSLNAVNSMLDKMNKKPITIEDYYKYVDTPIINFYKHILTDDELDFPKISSDFHEFYNSHLSDTPLVKDAKFVLNELKRKGANQFIITATKESSAKELTKQYGISEFFNNIIGADDFSAGSKIERAVKFFTENNIVANETVFIGDTLHDLETANHLGIDCILVTYGHQGEELVNLSGTTVCQSLKDVLFTICDDRAIDFHTHSSFSDGEKTPRELLKYARDNGLASLAITDHDSVDGIEEAIEYAESLENFEFIPGIEFSVTSDTEIHIIGLFIDHKNETLLSTINKTKSQRKNRMEDICKKLQNCGFDIKYKDAEKISGGNFVGRAHIARVMLEKGYVSDVKEAFDKYIGLNKPCYSVKKEITPEDAIKAIKSAGGLAFLAHLHQTKYDAEQLDNLLGKLKNYGLDGIEGYYTEYTEEHIKNFRLLAQKHGLFFSGGSDYHGKLKPNVNIKSGYGKLHMPYHILTTLKRLKTQK